MIRVDLLGDEDEAAQKKSRSPSAKCGGRVEIERAVRPLADQMHGQVRRDEPGAEGTALARRGQATRPRSRRTGCASQQARHLLRRRDQVGEHRDRPRAHRLDGRRPRSPSSERTVRTAAASRRSASCRYRSSRTTWFAPAGRRVPVGVEALDPPARPPAASTGRAQTAAARSSDQPSRPRKIGAVAAFGEREQEPRPRAPRPRSSFARCSSAKIPRPRAGAAVVTRARARRPALLAADRPSARACARRRRRRGRRPSRDRTPRLPAGLRSNHHSSSVGAHRRARPRPRRSGRAYVVAVGDASYVDELEELTAWTCRAPG